MQEIADKILRLSTRLEQLIKGADADIVAEIQAMQRELIALVANSDGVQTIKQVAQSRKNVDAIIGKYYDNIKQTLEKYQIATGTAATAAQLATYALLGAEAVDTFKDLDVAKIVSKSGKRVMPGTTGINLTVDEVLERFYENGSNSIKNIVTRSYTEGLSVTNITALVRDSTGLQKRQAEAVARTAILATANEARDTIASELGAEKAMWLATLDNKTCEYCQGQDGKCKDIDKIPKPPAHVNCRCVLLYLPEGTSCSELKSDLTRVERGASGKSISTSKYETYGEWIKTQPIEFQQDVLGKTRAKALNDGKITFKKMYTKTGKRRTIDSLLEHYK